jgi:hypothetical protein
MAEMSLCGSIPFRPGDNHSVPFPVSERSGSIPPVEPLGYPLKEQADRREKFLKSWNKLTYAKDAVSELHRDVGQLTDLIDLIPKNSDHIRGAINIVRKLIADSPGLIQVVAAMQDVALPVFGNGEALPLNLAPLTNFQVPGPFVLSLRWGFRFESDLDFWLMQEGAVINGERVSNRNVIKGIADKIGAHVDLRHRITVEKLLAGSSVRNIGETDLHSYVVQLASSVAQLGAKLIA